MNRFPKHETNTPRNIHWTTFAKGVFDRLQYPGGTVALSAVQAPPLRRGMFHNNYIAKIREREKRPIRSRKRGRTLCPFGGMDFLFDVCIHYSLQSSPG